MIYEQRNTRSTERNQIKNSSNDNQSNTRSTNPSRHSSILLSQNNRNSIESTTNTITNSNRPSTNQSSESNVERVFNDASTHGNNSGNGGPLNSQRTFSVIIQRRYTIKNIKNDTLLPSAVSLSQYHIFVGGFDGYLRVVKR